MTNKEQKPQKLNKVLHALRKKVVVQAVIAVQTIVITIALIFGMSAAWYTNVLQTSGLQFEAEAWGFSGSVTVGDTAIQASPGDSGIVSLTVSNTGDMTDVSLNVSKLKMEDVQMRQRLFFYVDAMDTRNGENMSRVYVNTRDSYTYTVLSGGELVLSQERYNDAPLKWQWVYDMLGYYFLGKVETTTEEVTDETTGETVEKAVYSAVADDYLRPVEYDLDSATFVDGMLETVDGTTTVADFLKQLGETDGYEGGITATEMPGYYQVSVDEEGYGIWVYLCSWAEIQNATAYDTALGKAAAEGKQETYVATLTMIGQPSQAEVTEVTTVAQLVEELNNGGTLQLQNDLVLTEAIVLDSTEKTVLDLNGHTVTGTAGSSVMQLSDGANLTVLNGEIIAQDAGKDVISVSGSNMTLSNVSITGDGDDAIDIADQKGALDSTVRLLDCTIDVDGCAVYLCGNSDLSEERTKVIIEDCVLNSGYITVMANGSQANWGTEIQIYNSELTGYYAAIYQPQGDSLTKLVQSTASGWTGIAVKAGDLEIIDSTVSGTGAKNTPKLAKSGYTDTGDAVYVDCSYQLPINVSISGSSNLTSTNSYAVQVFVPEEDGYSDYSSVVITGGTFSSDVSEFVPEGYKYASGTVTEDN